MSSEVHISRQHGPLRAYLATERRTSVFVTFRYVPWRVILQERPRSLASRSGRMQCMEAPFQLRTNQAFMLVVQVYSKCGMLLCVKIRASREFADIWPHIQWHHLRECQNATLSALRSKVSWPIIRLMPRAVLLLAALQAGIGPLLGAAAHFGRSDDCGSKKREQLAKHTTAEGHRTPQVRFQTLSKAGFRVLRGRVSGRW